MDIEVCFAVGFNDLPYFTRVFTATYGLSPSKCRKPRGKEDSRSALWLSGCPYCLGYEVASKGLLLSEHDLVALAVDDEDVDSFQSFEGRSALFDIYHLYSAEAIDSCVGE